MAASAALAFTVLAAVLWGTSFPANDLGLQATDAWTFMALRFGIAFGAGLAAAALLRALDASWLRSLWTWAVGLVNALSYELQFLGQSLHAPGAAALMVNVGNLAVPLLAFLVLGERLGGARAGAVALAAAGVVLVATRGSPEALAGSEFLGSLLTLAAGLCFALVIVLSKAALASRGAQDARSLVAFTTWVIGLTALLALPGAALLGSRVLAPQALLAAGYTGLATTVLAFLLWLAGLRALTSVVSGVVLLLEIVVALALSIALGLDALTLASALGALAILAAVALASAASPAAPPMPGAPAALVPPGEPGRGGRLGADEANVGGEAPRDGAHVGSPR